MSTITVVRKGNEVAIAADSLSSGNYDRQESAKYIVNHQKIFQVGDSFMAICGATSAKLALRKYFAFGSGEDYALGALFAAYEDESKSAEELARLGVAAAAEFNSKTAAPIFSQTVALKSC